MKKTEMKYKKDSESLKMYTEMGMILTFFLNLFFVGRTIASERLFDLIGCVFRNWQPVLLRRQNRHAASLRYRNCRGDIFREE